MPLFGAFISWCLYLVPLCGAIMWCLYVVPLFGAFIWCLYLVPLFGPKSGFEPVTCGLVTRKSDLYNMQAHPTFGNIGFGTSRRVCKISDDFWYIKVFYQTDTLEHNLREDGCHAPCYEAWIHVRASSCVSMHGTRIMLLRVNVRALLHKAWRVLATIA